MFSGTIGFIQFCCAGLAAYLWRADEFGCRHLGSFLVTTANAAVTTEAPRGRFKASGAGSRANQENALKQLTHTDAPFATEVQSFLKGKFPNFPASSGQQPMS